MNEMRRNNDQSELLQLVQKILITKMSTINYCRTGRDLSVQWSFCNPLRDDGVGCDDHLEQLTFAAL